MASTDAKLHMFIIDITAVCEAGSSLTNIQYYLGNDGLTHVQNAPFTILNPGEAVLVPAGMAALILNANFEPADEVRHVVQVPLVIKEWVSEVKPIIWDEIIEWNREYFKRTSEPGCQVRSAFEKFITSA